MAVTMDQVRAVLDPDEPDYAQAAALGPDAIPVLRQLAASDDPMLASKAVYLAGQINAPESVDVIQVAAQSADPILRVAAAGASRDLQTATAAAVLTRLLSDEDPGVRAVALKSVGADVPSELRSRVAQLSQEDVSPPIRELAREILDRIGGPSPS